MIELSLARNDLLSSLMAISGAVDKKQSLMILSNILFTMDASRVLLTATDLEIEMSASLPYLSCSEPGKVTIPAKKLIDIIRSLEEADLTIKIDTEVVTVKSGKSQFKLASLPADHFPTSDAQSSEVEFSISRQVLMNLLQSTYFAMAQQDVRVYLNSLLFEIDGQTITTVAMDGHRMAVYRHTDQFNFTTNQQFLIPRRGVSEMLRLLNLIQDEQLSISAGKGFFRVSTDKFSFITKLTESRFPHYRKAIPKEHDKFILIERDHLKRSLSRISILANEKTQGVMLLMQPDSLVLVAKNQEQEEASEQLDATIDGQALKIGVNAGYLLDVLNYFPDGLVRLSLSTTDQSILVESLGDENYQYITMPMKL